MIKTGIVNSKAANPELVTTSEVIHKRVADSKHRVCEVAARLFNSKNIDAVSIEAIVLEAGIARSTFYRFFDDKEDLLKKIIVPVFEQARRHLEALDPDKPENIVNGIADSYLKVWRDQPDALILTSGIGTKLFELVQTEHDKYADVIVRLMNNLDEAKLLRNDEPRLSAVILAQTAVRILQSCASHPQFENIYRNMLRGLLLKW